MAPVEHLVADTSAFLRGAPLQEIGRHIYTTREVLAEIRDRAARRRLASLPFELLLRQPFPEHVRLVTEFSKQTGDFCSLSAADIQVLALTLQLETEHGGGRPLRTDSRAQVQFSLTNRHPEAPVDVPGFHLPSKPKIKCPGSEKIHLAVKKEEPKDSAVLGDAEFSSFLFWRNPLPSIEEDLEGLLKADSLLLEMEDPDSQDSSKEESRKKEGWITPSNITQIQQNTSWGVESAEVQVGCVTTDFAMQNILMQMGLHVLAFSGLLIQHTRSYILHCHGCFRTTSKMTRLFCPHCGNKTLKKVAVTVKDDGSFHLHFSQNPKVLNSRGLRHSLPAPEGGKHASNPHLTEDQRFPQQRLSRKARQKTNAFDPNYMAGVSPFAEHDIYSRAANLQIRDAALGAGRRRLNPNTSNKKFLKKK